MKQELFPHIEPFETGLFKASEIHNIYWERSGKKAGEPILILHGGPGGGSDPLYRRYFDPRKYEIIQFDQRGCGKSLPNCELRENTTIDLIEDIEKLRNYLSINSWTIFGGSWGSTLGLIYSIKFRNKVKYLILRGVFLCRQSDINWFYQNGASCIFPEEFESFTEILNEKQKSNILRSYYDIFTSSDTLIKDKALKAWTRWEMSTSRLLIDRDYIKRSTDPLFYKAFSLIECHYFVNNIFMEDNYIINNIKKLKDLKTYIVHGRYDVVCPISNAWTLHCCLPKSQLYIVPDAGHSIQESGIIDNLINITNMLEYDKYK
tara:strand:+ start:6791 stop:7747 length:957 start_codon:yes stop_codon:yes gene_type:complete